jgi:hypothetical protein
MKTETIDIYIIRKRDGYKNWICGAGLNERGLKLISKTLDELIIEFGTQIGEFKEIDPTHYENDKIILIVDSGAHDTEAESFRAEEWEKDKL